MEIHRLTTRLRTLRRFGLDLCLGRIVSADDGEPVYVGRLGLTDSDGSPAAAGLALARRRAVLRRDSRQPDGPGQPPQVPLDAAAGSPTTGRRCSSPDGLEGHAALDDQSAFIASLGSSRSARMRDVLGTIQSDQDAIIRAGSRGALVVDGGPGTGKTVVALHRSAYLLYSDPRLGHRRGDVLFVGPHQPYLSYVADVLPSLGEEGVQTCTLRDLVPEGATAAVEPDPEVARLKASADMVKAIEPAVRLYEEPPTKPMTVETDWADIWLSTADWAEAFGRPSPARRTTWLATRSGTALLTILVDKLRDEPMTTTGTRTTTTSMRTGWPARAPQTRYAGRWPTIDELAEAFDRAWPLLEATDLVGDLWTVPAYLRMCAPWLERDEVARLQRADAQAWTASDLPLLDAALQRLGDPADVAPPSATGGGCRRRARAHGRCRRRPDRDRRLRDGRADVDAARPGPAHRPGRHPMPNRTSIPTCWPGRSRTSSSTRRRS